MKKTNHRVLSFFTWVVIFFVWLLLTEGGFVTAIKLPSPRRVFYAFVDILANGYNYIPLWKHIAISLFRLSISILVSIVLAVPLGLLCGYFPKARAVLSSMVNFVKPLPPLAYYTLLIVWLGIGEASKIMLLLIAAFIPIFVSGVYSVSRVNENYILTAKTFGASNRQIFFKVILPAALPEVFVGIRTAVSVAYTTLVSAEMIAATAGIGWMVLDAYKYLKTETVFVGIIIMGLTGILLDYILTLIEKKFIFWNGK
ncbi:MAG: ABC transporter permease [Treponemataceae bacterium]